MVQRITFSLLFTLLSMGVQSMHGMEQQQSPKIEHGESARPLITAGRIDDFIQGIEQLAQNGNAAPLRNLANTSNSLGRNVEYQNRMLALVEPKRRPTSFISRAATVNLTPIATDSSIIPEIATSSSMSDSEGTRGQDSNTSTATHGAIANLEQQVPQQSFISRYRYPLMIGSCAVAAIAVMRHFRQVR